MYFSPGIKERREDFFNFDIELSTLIRELTDLLPALRGEGFLAS